MSRLTVDFGIDLGTTNSAIGLLKGTEVEIIKNHEGFEYTPSAVFLDKSNSMIVGRRAKERLDIDPNNAFAEFKLQMGTNAEYVFARNGRRMKPEDLSAEVLKSLKANVRQRLNEEASAAVITVPAAFELPQCDATVKAAQLAGITFSPLVQEPVAAAFAYGFQSSGSKAFWLVYDFGGGTFDAAIVQTHDGIIEVVNNGGDNHLGGKLIDWAIVEELLVPAVASQFNVADFRRGNPKWQKALAKLKLAAEQAKIGVSRDESAEIMIDSLCQDEDGENITFEFDLKRADVERIAQPFILRSINICRKVLAEQNLKVDNIEKVLLVGGPTLTPYLRGYLSDRQEGLGIPLDFSLDPLTVVARGAAIVAAAQRNETSQPTPAAGKYAVNLDYKPAGNNTTPPIGGTVVANEAQSFSDFTIEFVNTSANSQWRSGAVPINDNGSFHTSLWVEEKQENRFQVELLDGAGRRCEVSPESFTYTHGFIEMDNPTLSHSVGLALANNEVRVFLEKGTQLPNRKRFVQKLIRRVRKATDDGVAADKIRIPVIEGEHKKADRNKLIGYLEISATKIKRDLPAGAEIEVTIDIDQSRIVRTEAYLPMLNEEYEVKLQMGQEVPDPVVLKEELVVEKKRLEEAREKAQLTVDETALPIMDRIDDEQILKEVESTLAAASVDQDAAIKCQNRLLDLKATVDQLEDALEIPVLLAEAEQMIKWTEKVVEKWGQPADQRKLSMLRRELRATMEARVLNPGDLNRKIDNMDDLRMRILRAQDEWWIDYLAHLEERREVMTNLPLAEELFTQARRSIQNNDIEGVKSACQQLNQLLPPRQLETSGRFGPDITN